jgi:hypothetical protein
MALPKAIVTLNGDCEMRCADHNCAEYGAARGKAAHDHAFAAEAEGCPCDTADCWRSGHAMLSIAGVTMRLAGGSVRLMNADTANEAAAKELVSPLMLLPLLFCCAETAGVATLNCWLMLMRSRAGPSNVLQHMTTAVSAANPWPCAR